MDFNFENKKIGTGMLLYKEATTRTVKKEYVNGVEAELKVPREEKGFKYVILVNGKINLKTAPIWFQAEECKAKEGDPIQFCYENTSFFKDGKTETREVYSNIHSVLIPVKQ